MRPHGEWAEVSSPTTVLPRRPRGVVPHADFRAALGTSWSPPPALQSLGHHLTLDAPTGLLAAAAVPVEAYAGAELRFTPAAEPADEPREPMTPGAAKPRLLNRILGRQEPAPMPPAVPSPAPPRLSTPESPELPNRAGESRPALRLPESRPTLAAASTPTVFRMPEAQAMPTDVERIRRSGPAPVEEMPPLAGPLSADPGVDAEVNLEVEHVATVDPAPSRRSGSDGLEEKQLAAGPLRVHEPPAPAAQRPLLGHRALGADLMAAAAEVVLPRPVAALAPVVLPAPVAGRATTAPAGGSDLAPPRPAGGWARPAAAYEAPPAPMAEPPTYARASAGPAFDAAPPRVARDVELPAPPAGPVEPEPGLPDWWPAQSTTWDVADADPGTGQVDHVADRAPTLDLPDLARPDLAQLDIDLPAVARSDVDLPDLAGPAVTEPFADPSRPAAARPAATHTEPMLQRRIRQTRDPATGMPVTRRVAWPLDVPTAHADPQAADGQPEPEDRSPDDQDSGQPHREQPAPDLLPDAAPLEARQAPTVPGLRRVVRVPAAAPETSRSQPPAFPLVGPSDGDLRADLPDLPDLHRFAPVELPEPSRSDGSADESGSSDAAAPASPAASPAARAKPAPTADDVAGELRHTLLVERERFGVLADLW